jgi:hypothetical protein
MEASAASTATQGCSHTSATGVSEEVVGMWGLRTVIMAKGGRGTRVVLVGSILCSPTSDVSDASSHVHIFRSSVHYCFVAARSLLSLSLSLTHSLAYLLAPTHSARFCPLHHVPKTPTCWTPLRRMMAAPTSCAPLT